LKQIGAVISTIDDGSITLPASSSKLTTSRNSTQPMPLSLIQAVIACGICSLVIRVVGNHCRQQTGADGGDGRRPLQSNSNEICFPGRPSASPPKQPNGGTRLGFASFFGAAEHL